MAPVTAQTDIQPETIAVLVVLGVAVLAMLVAFMALVRRRRRRQAERAEQVQDRPDPTRFDGKTDDQVIVAADRALAERDGRTLAAAALWLERRGHLQALPYLLHALRFAPRHHRQELLTVAAEHGPEELADHPLLAAALEPAVLDRLRDHLADQAASSAD